MRAVIFTEAGRNIGFGHLSRCISLCQAFAEERVLPRLIVSGDASIKGLLSYSKVKKINWLESRDEAVGLAAGADIAVIDSYLAKREFYRAISGCAGFTAALDDYNRLPYPCGMVINGAAGAEDIPYPKGAQTKYLLGARYALVRKEFQRPLRRRMSKTVKRIMITLGGTDHRVLIPRVLRQLNSLWPHLEKYVLIGRAFTREQIGLINRAKDKSTRLIYFPSLHRLREAMIDSDIAISSASQTIHELARVGTPAVAIAAAINQLHILRGSQKAGFIISAGRWDDARLMENLGSGLRRAMSYNCRLAMRRNGLKAIDGNGPARVVRAIMKVFRGKKVK